MLEKVSLFRNRRDFFHLFLLLFVLFSLSISMEFYNYKELTKFDTQLVNATVLKQYTKSKLTKTGKTKTYQVLKLKSDDGFVFYSTASKKLQDIRYRKVQLEAWAGKISFYEYMHGFYCFSKILHLYPNNSYKNRLNSFIDKQHKDKDISLLYQALFTAKQLPYKLQKLFSNLGVTHLIAISGFHLGVLSTLLYFLLKYPYTFLQNRYFPYRSYKLDSFIIIALFLLTYLLFLGSPPSLLRAFVMLLIGFVLYDRGVEVVTMQTLLLTVLLILALFPRLFFSLGFWLSSSGVFYIFLFLIYFKHLSKTVQFLLLPFWIYLMMLPYSLVIFGNFSIYHPLSILWTSLFTLFYPLAIFLHTFGYGNALDTPLEWLMSIETKAITLEVDYKLLLLQMALSLLALYRKVFLYILIGVCFTVFLYAFYCIMA